MQPKSLKDQLHEALERGEGITAIRRLLLRGVRARGHEVVDPEHRQVVDSYADETFVLSPDQKRAWARIGPLTIDAAEGIRQGINAICVRLESAEQNTEQELTPIDAVSAQLQRHYGRAF